jgi:hypothetical protein
MFPKDESQIRLFHKVIGSNIAANKVTDSGFSLFSTTLMWMNLKL